MPAGMRRTDGFAPGAGTGIRLVPVLLALILICGFATSGALAAPTSAVHVVKYAPDGTTVLNETTVTYQWMEANLPVTGDGVTHYYHQGPVFTENKEEQWDKNETTNFKDRGAVKGTDIKDLCNLVGGAGPGDEVMVKAADGYHVEFGYGNVYTPQARQGPMVLCWYNGGETGAGERQGVGYPPSYHTGMRLVFFADTSTNAGGMHVFGNNDMRAVMPPATIYLFDDLYPSTSGYTVKWVDEIRVYSGGYHGPAGTLAKSLQGNPVATATTPQKSPLFPLAGIGALALLVLLAGRRPS